MRQGPPRGESATLEVTVTRPMTARIAGKQVHPIYGTGALVGHVEEVCRGLLVPHLEEGEEGVGYRMEVVHRAPAPVGAELAVTATVADVGPKRLLCEFAVRHGQRLIAQGSFEQRVVELTDFLDQFEESASP